MGVQIIIIHKFSLGETNKGILLIRENLRITTIIATGSLLLSLSLLSCNLRHQLAFLHLLKTDPQLNNALAGEGSPNGKVRGQGAQSLEREKEEERKI